MAVTAARARGARPPSRAVDRARYMAVSSTLLLGPSFPSPLVSSLVMFFQQGCHLGIKWRVFLPPMAKHLAHVTRREAPRNAQYQRRPRSGRPSACCCYPASFRMALTSRKSLSKRSRAASKLGSKLSTASLFCSA